MKHHTPRLPRLGQQKGEALSTIVHTKQGMANSNFNV
jgi:hypothetical protein